MRLWLRNVRDFYIFTWGLCNWFGKLTIFPVFVLASPVVALVLMGLQEEEEE